MDNLVRTLTDPAFATTTPETDPDAAIHEARLWHDDGWTAAVVFTFGVSFVSTGPNIKARIKRVALERERMRAEEMARLRGTTIGDGDGRSTMRGVVRRAELGFVRRVRHAVEPMPC